MNLMFEPSSIALRPAFMIIGPSAGSENGTPISTMSAPFSVNVLNDE